jgi:hypothetical protein
MCNLNWTWIPGKCLCLMPKFLKYGLFTFLTFTNSTGRTKSPVPNTSSQDSLTTVNMPFSFRVGIDLSILPEPNNDIFFLILYQWIWCKLSWWLLMSLFFSEMRLMGLFYELNFLLFLNFLKLLLILTLINISQWELFHYGMKYRSWRRLMYLEVLSLYFSYFKSSSNINRYVSLRV